MGHGTKIHNATERSPALGTTLRARGEGDSQALQHGARALRPRSPQRHGHQRAHRRADRARDRTVRLDRAGTIREKSADRDITTIASDVHPIHDEGRWTATFGRVSPVLFLDGCAWGVLPLAV
jgi:hypothetical protein